MVVKSTVLVGFIEQLKRELGYNNLLFSPEFCARARRFMTILLELMYLPPYSPQLNPDE